MEVYVTVETDHTVPEGIRLSGTYAGYVSEKAFTKDDGGRSHLCLGS